MLIVPSARNGAITKLGTVSPAALTFKFDANGTLAPPNTVTYPAAVVSVATTVNTAAVASAGTPATPPTWTSIVPPAATRPFGPAAGSPARVSNTRVVSNGNNRPAATATSVGM